MPFPFQPQNIVLMGSFPNCEIKLCDLEVARVIQNGESIREIIGTPDYVGKHRHIKSVFFSVNERKRRLGYFKFILYKNLTL